MRQASSRRFAAFGIAGIAILAVVLIAVSVSRDGDGPAAPAAPTGDDRSPGSLSPLAGDPAAAPGRAGGHVEAVVSAHELATEAGLDVLARGGSAADAAVAVAAVLSVVEPWFSSALGGGTWALYYDAATGEITSLDGVGPTGSNATVADYAGRGDQSGMHQANVPGAWDGWMLWLEHYGRLDLAEVLEAAITVANEGYPVSEEMASWLGRSPILERTDTARIYAPDGEVLEEGDTVYQRDMARTFEALVAAYDARLDEGRDAAIQAARDYYYRGPLAEAIVAFSDGHGGYLTLPDFHGFEAAIVEPISIEYTDEVTVFQNPPNSQGITMLLALNVLKDYPLAELHAVDADAVHLQAEAIKLAFADRYYHVGDPERVDVPVAELLSDAHADRQRARIDMDRAISWPIPDELDPPVPASAEATHTTTFHIVDRDGNGAAVTTSLGAQFLVIGDTGIHINNRMRMVALEDGNPNQLSPGYKVRHTSNPYMALRNGQLYILGGNTGADTQPQGQVQQFISVVEFGMSAQEAVAKPRFVVTSFPAGTFPYAVGNVLRVEEDFSADLVEGLRARGHTVETGGTFGSANMIVVHEGGLDAEAGAEPRSSTALGVVLRPPP